MDVQITHKILQEQKLKKNLKKKIMGPLTKQRAKITSRCVKMLHLWKNIPKNVC